jgi:hypothetical protein
LKRKDFFKPRVANKAAKAVEEPPILHIEGARDEELLEMPQIPIEIVEPGALHEGEVPADVRQQV